MIVPRIAARLFAGLLSVGAACTALAAPPPGATSCSGCHARVAVTGPVPRIHGRAKDEVVTAMIAFRSGKATATVMDRIAKGFSDDEIDAIAEWLSQQR